MRFKNLIIAFLLNFIGGLGFIYLRDIRPLINILIVNVLVIIFCWVFYFVGVLASTDLAIFSIICIFGSALLLLLYSIIKIWQLSKPDIRANKDKLGFKNGYIFVLISIALSFTPQFIIITPIQSYSIPSGSMIPTLRVGDVIFSSKITKNLEYGDVLVFERPGNESVDFIKRLVGKPGDRIAVVDSVLFINGVEVERKLTALDPEDPAGQDPRVMPFKETMPNGVEYIVLERSLDAANSAADNMPEQMVPTGHYFFMGDNRDRAYDSRFDVGPVPSNNIKYKANYIMFSHNGTAEFFEVHKWLSAIRFSRIGKTIL